MFQPRFAAAVERGEKRQTIRPEPKRIPKVGDLVSCREWTGAPYRSKQRVLFEAPIERVEEVYLTESGVVKAPGSGSLLSVLGVREIMLQGEEADRFARADGFKDWAELREWFETTHGLPFRGILISW